MATALTRAAATEPAFLIWQVAEDQDLLRHIDDAAWSIINAKGVTDGGLLKSFKRAMPDSESRELEERSLSVSPCQSVCQSVSQSVSQCQPASQSASQAAGVSLSVSRAVGQCSSVIVPLGSLRRVHHPMEGRSHHHLLTVAGESASREVARRCARAAPVG